MSAKWLKNEKMKRLLILVPVVAALIVVIALMRNTRQPEKVLPEEESRNVRAIKLEPVDVVPRAIGYGYVEPGRVWKVVPEVSGTIVRVSPRFEKGNFIQKGEFVLQIDDTNYRLIERQMVASIAGIEVRLSELEYQQSNYKASLAIQKALLELKQKELQRKQQALDNNAISLSEFEHAAMDYQGQLAQVQEIENGLELIPVNRKAFEADLEYNRAKLEEARVSLTRTEIKAPYTCRITEILAEVGQFVQQGQEIASADDINQVDIPVQIPLQKVLSLFSGMNEKNVDVLARGSNLDSLENVKEKLGLKPVVRLPSGSGKITWEAKFSRTDATIDPQAHTIGVIVSVEEPYAQVSLGIRPSLVRNMFCEVEISGRPLEKRLVIPREALHDNTVFVVDADNRLLRKQVSVLLTQSDFYVVDSGLNPGDFVVVSDLTPAIEGILLTVEEDSDLTLRLKNQASGQIDLMMRSK